MNIKKKLLGMGLVSILSLSIATGAFAANDVTKTDDVDFTVKSADIGNGGLDLETSPIVSYGEIKLQADPTTYNTSFTKQFTVKDLRGTHEGWSLTVSASQFDSGTHQLPTGSLTLDAVNSIARVGVGTGPIPTKELTATNIIDDGAVLISNAPVGTGMGVFDLDFNTGALGLTVDATTAKIGSYVSTLTWNLVAAPSGS